MKGVACLVAAMAVGAVVGEERYDGAVAWPDVKRVYYDPADTPDVEPKVGTNDFTANIEVEMRQLAGRPVIHINGEPFPMNMGHVWTWRRKGHVPRYGAFRRNVVCCALEPEMWYKKLGECDFAFLDKWFENMAKGAPDAYFMTELFLYPPKEEFLRTYPGEMAKDSLGNVDPYVRWCFSYSYASKVSLQELGDVAVKVVRWVENSRWRNRVIGYRFTSGWGPEWIGWPTRANAVYDFSTNAVAGFAAYAAAHHPNLKDPHVPTKAERFPNDGRADLLWRYGEHENEIAYADYAGGLPMNFFLTIARRMRTELKALGRRKLIGTYYGYTCHGNYCGCNQFRAHTRLKEFLDANDGAIDFLMSPQSYGPRFLGDTTGDMKPFRTLQDHGILPVIEDDLRTHCAPADAKWDTYSAACTPAQSVAMAERGFAIALCRGTFPLQYALVSAFEYDFPEMRLPASRLDAAVKESVASPFARRAEVALVVSERSVAATPMSWYPQPTGFTYQHYAVDGKVERYAETNHVFYGEVYDHVYNRFARAGAPCDQLLAEDLPDHPGDYKLYVFLDLLRYDEKVLEAVRRIRRRGATVLWLYAPGWMGRGECSVEAMKRLTGISFEEIYGGRIDAGVTVTKDGRYMGMPTRVARMFAPTDEGEVLGRYSNGKVGLARFAIDGGKSYFFGGWQLDQQFIGELEEDAGVHRYTLTGDPMEANDGFFTLHARTPGLKTVRLPKKVREVYDILNDRTVARDTDVFTFESKLHETWLFRLKE